MLNHIVLVFLSVSILAFGFLWVICSINKPKESEMSIGWHRIYGKYRVKYSDGQLSQPFTYNVARDYAKMFDGIVIPA